MNYIFKATFLILLFSALLTSNAFAHEGHDDAPGAESDNSSSEPISITDQSRKNLKLEVSEAEIQTIDKTTSVIGQIEAIPSNSASITSRISGRVASVQALDGAKVKKGDALVDVESRQIGDPPPHVKYFSPIDGIILDRHVVPGDTVEPDKHLVEIADLSAVYAEGRIYEGQVSLVKIGQTVRVGVESYPDEIFLGKIERISGALDPETRTLKVWVRIENPDLKLRPNMRATLNIVTSQSDSVITVPISAVLGEAGNYFVFVQSDTDPLSFQRRSVVLGIRDDQFIEISEGIFPSDKVVTVGNYQLQYVSTKKKPEIKNSAEHKG